jgi:hypothetical protein
VAPARGEVGIGHLAYGEKRHTSIIRMFDRMFDGGVWVRESECALEW